MPAHLVVLWLLIQPTDPFAEPVHQHPDWPAGTAALRDYCDALGVTDHRDAWSSFAAELTWARRTIPLALESPPAEVVESLPPLAVCIDRHEFAEQLLRRWRDAAYLSGRPGDEREWVADQEWRCCCWRTAVEARRASRLWETRLALRRLQELAEGQGLPAHAPVAALRWMP